MNAIGAEFNDWDKHFKLMADIDLGTYTGESFNIIGYSFLPFTGVFDGNGHTISNFTYISHGIPIGLFADVWGENALIKDLRLIDPNVDAGTSHIVGSLAGSLSGSTISNCYAEGGNVSGETDVGGLVGANNGSITGSYSTCTVTGSGRLVGGLVGENRGSITTSCSSGAVSGTGHYVGGLVGSNFGSITSSSSTGTVSGTGDCVGGLVGSNSGSITSSSGTGAVSGTNLVGGLVGSNSYDGRINTSYSTGTVGGTGDSVGGLVGGNSGSMTSSSSTSTVSGDWGAGGLVGSNLGNITSSSSAGAVSGYGYGDVGGLVGYNHGTVTHCYSTGAVTGDSCGGLVGDNRGSVTTSYSTGTVTGDSWVGGLVGQNSGSITTSYSTGSVSGAWYVGGLVGDNYYGTITHCYSTSAVSPSGEVGGLIGRSSGTVTSCFWDKQTSGMNNMCGIQEWVGVGCDDSHGKATTEMQTGSTFLDAGWDFVDETANGTEDIWDICEGIDYPKLAWQFGLCADHPDYSEWIEVGEPVCWCYSRQCHGDADGKSQGKKKYWVSTDDLDILIAAWNKTFAEIEGEALNGVPLICADFDHMPQGKKQYRVSTDDLDILIANWQVANGPAPDCP
jgi:hypothetical protein